MRKETQQRKLRSSDIDTLSATSLTTLLISRWSSDLVHMHGLNVNVTEEKVSRHIMTEDLHGMMVTVAYLRALHLEARELTGKAALALPQNTSTHTNWLRNTTLQCDTRIIHSGFN
jgi:hypothetical protein